MARKASSSAAENGVLQQALLVQQDKRFGLGNTYIVVRKGKNLRRLVRQVCWYKVEPFPYPYMGKYIGIRTILRKMPGNITPDTFPCMAGKQEKLTVCLVPYTIAAQLGQPHHPLHSPRGNLVCGRAEQTFIAGIQVVRVIGIGVKLVIYRYGNVLYIGRCITEYIIGKPQCFRGTFQQQCG